MWVVIQIIAQLVTVWLENCFEKDKDKKKQKEGLRVEAKEAMASKDVDRMVSVLDRMQRR